MLSCTSPGSETIQVLAIKRTDGVIVTDDISANGLEMLQDAAQRSSMQ